MTADEWDQMCGGSQDDADRDQATRDRLAEATEDLAARLLSFRVGSSFQSAATYAHAAFLVRDGLNAALLPVVAELVREGQAEAVREFYLDAADRATVLGRRGPDAIADWLLDIGSERLAALRAPRDEGATG